MNGLKRTGWLEAKADDVEFQRLYAREDLIEDFLHAIDAEMARQQVSRSELARRLGCKPANITRIMRRTTNLTASTLVDIAFVLGLQVRLDVKPGARKWFGFKKSGCLVLPFAREKAPQWRSFHGPQPAGHSSPASDGVAS